MIIICTNYYRSGRPRRACVVNYFADTARSNTNECLLKRYHNQAYTSLLYFVGACSNNESNNITFYDQYDLERGEDMFWYLFGLKFLLYVLVHAIYATRISTYIGCYSLFWPVQVQFHLNTTRISLK